MLSKKIFSHSKGYAYLYTVDRCVDPVLCLASPSVGLATSILLI